MCSDYVSCLCKKGLPVRLCALFPHITQIPLFVPNLHGIDSMFDRRGSYVLSLDGFSLKWPIWSESDYALPSLRKKIMMLWREKMDRTTAFLCLFHASLTFPLLPMNWISITPCLRAGERSKAFHQYFIPQWHFSTIFTTSSYSLSWPEAKKGRTDAVRRSNQ